jgi:hypothetical protein
MTNPYFFSLWDQLLEQCTKDLSMDANEGLLSKLIYSSTTIVERRGSHSSLESSSSDVMALTKATTGLTQE